MTSRLRMRRAAWITGPVMAIALLLSACSGSSTNGPKDADSFTFALQAAPSSLDLAKNYGGATLQMVAPVTEKIEQISVSGKISPGLATSVSQPDDTTIVYTIRSGVKFSDGNPLTADDVAWSLTHVATPGTATAGRLTSFDSATATGPLEVTVKLKRPDPSARVLIAAVGAIQEAKFAQEHPDDLGTAAALPIGTGPYKFSSYTPQEVTLTRNPHYWGSKPPVNKIEFNFIAEDNTARLAMQSGSIQGAMVNDLKTIKQWQTIKGVTTHVLPSTSTAFLTLDTSEAPLNDIHVRKAIAYSVDSAGIMQAGYGDYAKKLNSVCPPVLLEGVAPSAKSVQTFLDSLPTYSLDPAKAKAELSKSAYPQGFSLTVPYITGTPWSELAVLNLAQNMKALGVTITPQTGKPEPMGGSDHRAQEPRDTDTPLWYAARSQYSPRRSRRPIQYGPGQLQLRELDHA